MGPIDKKDNDKKMVSKLWKAISRKSVSFRQDKTTLC